MGVAGAGTGNKAILLTGFAGLIAGACSMALGEWLSVTNARELASTQIAREAEELDISPEAEEHELMLIYRAKGLDADEARRVASQMITGETLASPQPGRLESGLLPPCLHSVLDGSWASRSLKDHSRREPSLNSTSFQHIGFETTGGVRLAARLNANSNCLGSASGCS